MEYDYIEKRYNVMSLSSIMAFAGINGGMNGNCKDVYFLRVTGVNGTFENDIREMDRVQTGRMQLGQSIYNRVGAFPKGIGADEVTAYTACYDKWIGSKRTHLFTGKLKEDSGTGTLLSASCSKVLELYKHNNIRFNPSIEKNFVVKLLFWTDMLAYDYLKNWNPKMTMKFVAQEVCREQEYLFCHFLTLLGIDVLLLQNNLDIDDNLDSLKLSKKLILGEKKEVVLEAYDKQKFISAGCRKEVSSEGSGQVKTETITGTGEQPRPRVAIPAHRRDGAVRDAMGEGKVQGATQSVRRELDFEELALRASSVVMISIHNNQGDIIGSGSGIMIGPAGYILTNNHVARGGKFYSVRIENDDTMYKTDEIIKYNSLLDLAVIRIQRTLQPLPVYKGNKPLVRGQKVVAIGSPLGLFNSVSNGIISGFRKIDDVDMIQFTAPISHGSSGGAVLNMYGEVIGVSTAGIDDGQNINLAVGYEFINTFIRGFQ